MLQSFENLPLYSLFIKENLFVVVFSTHVTSYGTAVNYIPLSGYAWDPYIVKGRHCKLLAKLDYSMVFVCSVRMYVVYAVWPSYMSQCCYYNSQHYNSVKMGIPFNY